VRGNAVLALVYCGKVLPSRAAAAAAAA
jgi:hypothetical protein